MKIHRCFLVIALTFLLFANTLYSQIENIPISNPIYDYLTLIETKGILKHYSLTQIPWQKKKIISALILTRQNDSLLSSSEKKILEKFELEFGIIQPQRAVLFYSDTDTTQVFSKRIISNDEKYIYHYADNNNNVQIIPLAAIENISKIEPENNSSNLVMGTLGLRLSGTLTNNFGYNLQITNTAMLTGDTSLSALDNRFAHHTKVKYYNADADLQESHVALQKE